MKHAIFSQIRPTIDLLILDIFIPLWPEGDPAIQHSLDILLELHETKEMCRPKHILGITADKKITGEAADKFEQYTWSIVEYSESNDEWLQRALNCTKYVQIQHARRKPFDTPDEERVDLAIICALAKPELEEVLKLPWNWSAARPIEGKIFVHDGHLTVNGKKITVCAVSAPRMGMVATAVLSSAIITAMRPRLLTMCGICAGVRGKVEIGDVLLAEPAWDFQNGKWIGESKETKFAMSPHQIHASGLIRAHVEQLCADTSLLSKISADFPDAPRNPKIWIGPVASGSAVLADGQVINEIKVQHRNLLGVEMEVYGMYAAALDAPSPRPETFALKAVCDFADPDKGNNYQRFAAYTSAKILEALLTRFGRGLIET